ncbi:hypothetical protein ACFPVY_01040 [Flavobacterium qiangtangense]|uniref:Lipoprotein n=1 Tax=Flavobacterium qiangtangense TaxID=1442595 RepID=A0ABW1PJW4_9FLAO
MKKIIWPILIAIIYSSCNPVAKEPQKTATEITLDSIKSEYKIAILDIDKEYHIVSNREILNKLFAKNFYILTRDNPAILKELNTADNYFEIIYKKNDSVIKRSVKKLEKLQASGNESPLKVSTEIENSLFRLTMLKVKFFDSYLNSSAIINSVRNIIYLKINNKNDIKDGKIVFYNEKTLHDFNLKLNEIENLKIKNNEIREEIMNLHLD